MQVVRNGRTRFVILTDGYAFKIARSGIGYSFARMLDVLRRGQRQEKSEEWRRDRGGVLRVILQALAAGVLANVHEYRLSKKGSGNQFAETIFSMGIVNIQRRGAPVRRERIYAHPIWNILQSRTKNPSIVEDTMRPEQFCEIAGELYLADCGNPILWNVLKTG